MILLKGWYKEGAVTEAAWSGISSAPDNLTHPLLKIERPSVG
ncbi:MAG: hypothetical protein ACLR2C_09855 [Parasutterella excrementihominis]